MGTGKYVDTLKEAAVFLNVFNKER
jgi:hypothetical protein